MKVSNKNAREYVERKQEFKGNNTFAEYIGNDYVVYSYGRHFPIYTFKNGKWYANSDKYSVSTSKHQTQLCPNEHIFRFCNTELMKKLPYISALESLTV